MLDDITNQLKEKIQGGMKEKFGLSESESEQSFSILVEKFKNSFSEETVRDNFSQLKSLFQEKVMETSQLKDKLNKETVSELMAKVGLSEETANKVNDFSIETFKTQVKESFAELEGKFDISSMLEKIIPDKFEENAKDLMQNFNKFFNKEEK
jgi:hypothetical protein